MKRPMTGAVALALAIACSGVAGRAQEEPSYTNLKVLDADISREALGGIMLANLRGLGLP